MQVGLQDMGHCTDHVPKLFRTSNVNRTIEDLTKLTRQLKNSLT